MLDETMKSPITTEQMLVVTMRELIEGTLFHNENVRLSDALNAEARQFSRYITLKDAAVFSLSTGREIMKTAFIMVAHDHIIYMTPKGCVQAATMQLQPNSAQPEIQKGVAAAVAASTATPAATSSPQDKQPGPEFSADGKTIHPLSHQAILETLAAIRGQTRHATDDAPVPR